jgi:hypothetical protein
MIKKTKNYDIFKLRDDNRAKIDQAHIKKLIESIKSRNLLDLRPIYVNKNMEIIDGQHRLLAAKELGLDIYYQLEDKLQIEDIIIMNTNKNWTINDFFNFFIKNDYDEYIKLNNFIKKNNLDLKVGLDICVGRQHEDYHNFKTGNFIFKNECEENLIEICWETIDFIKKIKGYANCRFMKTARFWKALLRLIKHDTFNHKKWKNNLERQIEKIGPRISTQSYVDCFLDIYNWKSGEKLQDI